jgi:hypothetical protein
MMNEKIKTGSDAEMEPKGNASAEVQTEGSGYWCVICGRFLQAEEHEGGNLIVHDDIPHPGNMDFGDNANPQ